ncbi:MAG: DNA replication/repair protein RecF [Actinomycetota bacterium]
MHIEMISLVNFRTYKDLDLQLHPGVNLFLGNNGQGKTNLAEAIIYSSTLSSHRVFQNSPLIRLGEKKALIKVRAKKNQKSAELEIILSSNAPTKAKINKQSMVKTSDALGLVSAVIFSPEDLSLIKGEPAERRKFLDNLLSSYSPMFFGIIKDYERVLKQKSFLLKSSFSLRENNKSFLNTLDAWDDQLSACGTEIIYGRKKMLSLIKIWSNQFYNEVSSSENSLSLDYISSINNLEKENLPSLLGESKEDIKLKFLQRIQQLRGKEVQRGVCLVGPHRDDIKLSLDKFPARGYASQGESWSIALSLKLAAYEIIKERMSTEPVLILDDVFSELDKSRRKKLSEIITRCDQVIITASVEEDCPRFSSMKKFFVSRGKISPI